ncbi:hypothetical protein [Candidatus Liberibacter brunswickensis]|uniref:hypothetical protein n=1 Tax=Candidatus Liberibacter brunswickensis TaxID=1968796 RepID=UPI002FE3D3DF
MVFKLKRIAMDMNIILLVSAVIDAHIQSIIVALSSVPDHAFWASYEPLRKKLEQQKGLIELIRNESIENTYTEVESYTKDLEDRFKTGCRRS